MLNHSFATIFQYSLGGWRAAAPTALMLQGIVWLGQDMKWTWIESICSIAEARVCLISLWSQQCMSPDKQTLEGIRVLPCNLEITSKWSVLFASSYSCRIPARSAAESFVTEYTQMKPCLVMGFQISNNHISNHGFHNAIMLILYNISTSSVRLMSIPKRSSPGSNVISSTTSATPGKNQSLMPCIVWIVASWFCCSPQIDSFPANWVFIFNN